MRCSFSTVAYFLSSDAHFWRRCSKRKELPAVINAPTITPSKVRIAVICAGFKTALQRSLFVWVKDNVIISATKLAARFQTTESIFR